MDDDIADERSTEEIRTTIDAMVWAPSLSRMRPDVVAVDGMGRIIGARSLGVARWRCAWRLHLGCPRPDAGGRDYRDCRGDQHERWRWTP